VCNGKLCSSLSSLLIALVLYEYRLRKPDQIVVAEARGGVRLRGGRVYPRHFSTPITKTTHSFSQTVDASAKGNLDIRVKLAVTVAASMEDLDTLVKVGGWAPDAIGARAARETRNADTRVRQGIHGTPRGRRALVGENPRLSSRSASRRANTSSASRSSRSRSPRSIPQSADRRGDPPKRTCPHTRTDGISSQQARVAATRVRLARTKKSPRSSTRSRSGKIRAAACGIREESSLAGTGREHELSLRRSA